MISPSNLAAFANLAAAAADLVQDAAAPPAPARRAATTARATYVPSNGTLPTFIGRAVAGLAGARRPSRPVARRATTRSSGAGYAKATASKKDPLSFLKDPKLSIEEKLIKLLGYLNQKWEKEMQDKLDKIAAGENPQPTAAAKSSSKKKGGLLGSITGALKSVLGPAGIALEALKIPAVRAMVNKIGGPVLAAAATAMGVPALAPLLLKHGPALVEAAAGVASSLGGAQVSGADASGSASSSAASGTKKMSDSERQMLMQEIQRLQQKQQEMFGLVSNILKSNHDTRMSMINNIR